MVAMETSSHVDSSILYQIVARLCLEKVTKFGSVCCHIKKVNDIQSRPDRIPLV